VDKNGKQILIEYDGIQHFEANPKRGGEEKFEIDIINDERKNIFTKENNLKLIRIAYTDFKNINDEVIKGLESENQLFLSSKYPPLGWNDPKRKIPTQSSESKIKRDYVLTESQLKTIVESTSNERFERKIKQFILSKYKEVSDVLLEELTTSLQVASKDRTPIKLIFDKKAATYSDMVEIKNKIKEDLQSYLSLETNPFKTSFELKIEN
jgi:hypothetical protein